MGNFKYCRVCLVTDVKMFSLETSSSDSIGAVYSHLAQIPIFDKDQHVCFECASLLYKFQEFKSKCLRAHHILSRFKFGLSHITKQSINNIDRKLNKLESNLEVTHILSVHEVINVDTEIEIRQNEAEETKELEVSVKTEVADPKLDEQYESDESPIDNNAGLVHFTEETLEIEETKTKKRKFKTVMKSEDDFSDDEPLSKSMSQTDTVIKGTGKKMDMSIFDDYGTVTYLTPEDAKKELLLRKESNNYKMCKFKCELCYRGFEVKSAFENHTKKHRAENGYYECDICHLWFPQQVALCKHRIRTHKRKFSCKVCSYVCYCMHQAKTHVSLHKGKKYPCKHCGEIFSMPNSLFMHNRIKHLKESTVRESVCQLCGDVFGGPKGLYLHHMKVHKQVENDELGPKCEDCNAHFTSELAWKRHLVLSSKHKVSNGCKFCGDTFSNKEDLKAHLLVHSRTQVYRPRVKKWPGACHICDKWLTSRAEYQNHVTSDHPDTDEAKKIFIEKETSFVCELCGQIFKKQCFLKYHMHKHTGERPYKCPECDKTFQTSGSLCIHRSTHNPKTVKCHLCARRFTLKSALSKHMKYAHLGHRPYKCTICDKGFVHLCDLKQHNKYVHDKVPWPKKKPKRNTVDEETYMD
ncbi:zinc finger protein 83 isoform X1 [Spodoptera frugiperda]|uniref:Zinc finger protein 83 isoform X1 n=1 Tax=Spodoptera frugiperda TaxID=7108 RepID=A0A9R0ED98_SPOFR|nr:zinc finger protein 83 isoform X1 [Spodoptera frugiperda]